VREGYQLAVGLKQLEAAVPFLDVFEMVVIEFENSSQNYS
jgi:hypothetical protein